MREQATPDIVDKTGNASENAVYRCRCIPRFLLGIPLENTLKRLHVDLNSISGHSIAWLQPIRWGFCARSSLTGVRGIMRGGIGWQRHHKAFQ